MRARVLALLAAFCFAAASTAHAANIDFNTVPTGGTALTTYTEYGFTVSNYAPGVGQWYENHNQGNPNPGLTSGLTYGSTDGSGTIEVTEGGAIFGFTSVDLGTYLSAVNFTITGYTGGVGGTQVFTVSGSDTDTVVNGSISVMGTNGGVFTEFGTAYGDLSGITGNINAGVDTVLIKVSDSTAGSEMGIDNIGLATPEPSSLVLLGTGLMGLAGVARRRILA